MLHIHTQVMYLTIINDYYRAREAVNTLLLVFFEVRESDEGQLVPYKGFWCRERLRVALVILDIIEITRIDIAAQLRYDGGHGCTKNTNASAQCNVEKLNICAACIRSALGIPARKPYGVTHCL